MPNHAWELAQLNIGVTVAPLDSPELAGFVAALEPINALADTAPGFVWRLQDDNGDATSFRAFGAESILVNMSVWESIEALGDFVYRSDHAQIMRQRRKWFVKLEEIITVLWWVPSGHRPSITEAEERLVALRTNGPGPFAFSFREPFPAPGSGSPTAAEAPDDWLCPA